MCGANNSVHLYSNFDSENAIEKAYYSHHCVP